MRQFKIHRDYHGLGCNIIEKDEITILSGVTVLVGCNGAGKSTLICQLKDILTGLNIPYMEYDNLRDGGDKRASWAGYTGDLKTLASMVQSSEGENIHFNIGEFAGKIGDFVRRQSRGADIWVFLDAVDSGLSVDNIVEVKNFFNFAQDTDKDKTFHFIVSANEYEMARGEYCFDVQSGEYVTFDNYEEYREFVLSSREIKDRRKYKKVKTRRRT